MKPQKTVILTDSKAALQSLISNTPEQPIHQLLKNLQLLPQECTVVLQWILAHRRIPGNEKADHLAKSGSKQLQPMSISTYREVKTLFRNRQKCQRKRATGDYNPSTDPVNRQARHEQLYSGCKQDTVACERTWTAEANWHHGLCTLWLQRSRTDGPPHRPRLSHLVETETPVMAAGWVNHQHAVGNGGRPAPHHPIPGNMWTEGLSTADRPQKKWTVFLLRNIKLLSAYGAHDLQSGNSQQSHLFPIFILIMPYVRSSPWVVAHFVITHTAIRSGLDPANLSQTDSSDSCNSRSIVVLHSRPA